MKSSLGSLFLATGLAIGIPASLQAATFTPNVFDDPTPVAAPNGCTGQGSNPTRCSLREASLAANASAGSDTIVLGEGTYQLTILEAGTPESGDLDFVEGVDFGIIIQGQGPALTKIQASSGLNDRLIEITGTSVDMQLEGITFEDGNTTGDGGAVNYSISGSFANDFIIRNCDFLNNTASGDGGAVYMSSGNPFVEIDGGTYQGNRAIGGDGGALYLGHGSADTSRLDSVKNLVLTGNQALSAGGGAVYQTANNGISFENVQATGNRASSSGAFEIGNGGSPIGLQVLNSVISSNVATGGTAGGLSLNSSGRFVLINSTLSDNEADGDGGGAAVNNGGGLQILGSTFSGNVGESGGGLWYDGGSATINEITNSTFSGNDANSLGGGIYMDGPIGFPIRNVTIAGNSATTGGGIYSFAGQANLQNSILTDNDSSSNSDDCEGNIDSSGFNIFGSPNNADCDPNGVNVGTNPDDIVGDPKIGPLADNGGPTLTYALLIDSPALNGGNPAGCEDGQGDPLSTDQRGFTRPVGTACDIGAVETSVADLAIEKTADAVTYVVGDEITYTLTVTNNGPDAASASIEDVLPAKVSLVSLEAPCTDNAGTVTCDLGLLDAGESVSVHVVVEANDDGPVDNTATVSGADIDTDPSNNSSTVSVDVLSNGGGGGCNLGSSRSFGSAWALLGLGLAATTLLRRKGSRVY